MTYKSDPVAIVIKKLNVDYFLPSIQREFVWGPDKTISLFDSIMRGYPISSFLFWQVDFENRDKWEMYKFVENAVQGDTHSELASPEGVREPTLILDGQQRLTAFLIGLRGTYTTKRKYRRKDNPDAWEKKRLYLNLFGVPNVGEDHDQTSPYFDFQFFSNEPRNDDAQHWFKVGRILDFGEEDSFYEFKRQEKENLPDTVTKGQVSVLEQNLDRLYRAVWKDDVVVYYMEPGQDYDRVLDIFIRANERGEPLSKSDLLLSMVTSNWKGMNAREEIFRFLDHINKELTRKNDFRKDFIMKTCLVLCDLSVAYRVQNFTKKNLSLIESKWKSIKHAIERGVEVVNSFGIDENTLISKNALIPVIYYLFQHPQITLRGEERFNVQNAAAVRCLLTIALLNNVFGGSSDNILSSIRAVLQKHTTEANFPVDAINAKIAENGRTAYFNTQALDKFLSITYGGMKAFLALSILYDDNNWGVKTFHQDHIFPQAMFNLSAMEESGFSSDDWYRYSLLKNKIGNLELLLDHENQEKLNKPFDQWISTRGSTFKSRHLIPDNSELWKFERFEDFVTERERLIRKRLETLFGPPKDKE